LIVQIRIDSRHKVGPLDVAALTAPRDIDDGRGHDRTVSRYDGTRRDDFCYVIAVDDLRVSGDFDVDGQAGTGIEQRPELPPAEESLRDPVRIGAVFFPCPNGNS